jgi:hypothetical protein
MYDNPEPGQRDWRISGELWAWIHPLLPVRKPHPVGCHRRGWTIAGPWMPFSLCYSPDVSAMP